GYNFTDIGAVPQSYSLNHWYRLQVDWGTSGAISGKLFDSDGTTLLNTVTATDTAITSGGIAFRSLGSGSKYFDTVQRTAGVNTATGAVVSQSGPLAQSGTDW